MLALQNLLLVPSQEEMATENGVSESVDCPMPTMRPTSLSRRERAFELQAREALEP